MQAAGEVQALKRFFAMLNEDPDRALYGFNHVGRANDVQAIEVLLVVDSLFRCVHLQRDSECFFVFHDLLVCPLCVRVF